MARVSITKGCKYISHKKAIGFVMKRVRGEHKNVRRWEIQRDVYFRWLEKGRPLWVGQGKELRMRKNRDVYLCPSKW